MRTETRWETTVGLLGRKSLSEDEGLWIEGCSCIHMFFMRFPIDAIFMDAEGVILSIRKNLKPWRMAWQRGARSVLELSANASEKLDIRENDVIDSIL